MGFLDKLKHFAGGHGVKVEHTQIERQDPGAVTLPIGDTVLKGKFRVVSDEPCEVLSMKASFGMEIEYDDGRKEFVVLGEDVFPEPNASRTDDMVAYPYALSAGAEVEDYFLIRMESSIETELEKRNLGVFDVKFLVKTRVDVKGSPFDPETVNEVRVLA